MLIFGRRCSTPLNDFCQRRLFVFLFMKSCILFFFSFPFFFINKHGYDHARLATGIIYQLTIMSKTHQFSDVVYINNHWLLAQALVHTPL